MAACSRVSKTSLYCQKGCLSIAVVIRERFTTEENNGLCGFSGYLSWHSEVRASAQTDRAMSRALSHRGPDAEGFWQDTDLGIALVHRRLAIQDLSASGAQPMESATGRFVIAFNGEIYNFLSLKFELESGGISFRGHSDTEVMLAAFEAWGVEASLKRFAGMFAFALVDREDSRLYLARDRMGEKPLYFGWQGQTLLFGSELKALQCHPDWQGEINEGALPLFLRHNFIPAPHTIYKGISKLLPGQYLAFDLGRIPSGQVPEPARYWRAEDHFEENLAWTWEAAAGQLENLLDRVIGEQMVSDVPLGAFLSGGIDSSTVVALMQRQAHQRVRTFSIGFEEEGFNEAIYAAAVARHLKTDHTELYVKPRDALELIPRMPSVYDEPFADSSQLPTYLVSQMTREHVTVALSGDGGDELFCGYTRYFHMLRQWRERASPKARLRRSVANLPPVLMAPIVRTLVAGQRQRSLAGVRYRLEEERARDAMASLSEFYRQRVSLIARPEAVLKQSREPEYGLNTALPLQIPEATLKTLVWRDLNWYLPDDILVKVDRAAMANSLETRVPMLDHRVVEFALGLPENLNVSEGQGKRILREVLYRHVPRELVERPKQGFAVPIAGWLRGELRDWAEELLSKRRLKDQGYWHEDSVRWLWEEHLTGREDFSSQLWGVLMFQAWYEHNRL